MGAAPLGQGLPGVIEVGDHPHAGQAFLFAAHRGATCPQAGFWQCAATPALGDARRFIPAGMALPTVVVRCPERSFFQKLKNEPENHLTETTWTLVAYPDTRERT